MIMTYNDAVKRCKAGKRIKVWSWRDGIYLFYDGNEILKRTLDQVNAFKPSETEIQSMDWVVDETAD